MGYLHEGHLALVKASEAHCDVTVASIFVNPTQFGPSEAIAAYQRDLSRDETLCREAGVAIVFAPDVQELYPAHLDTFVEPGELANSLCGVFRPWRFRGGDGGLQAAQFAAAGRSHFFGEKDFQQCAVVRRAVADLNLPVEIMTVMPTVREPDGLAMSSRNRYLDEEERLRPCHQPQAVRCRGRISGR
ncbi:pantoate--beta-alanine ligase [Bradyrhizobium sp. CCGE-LA001]|uniref:pantoate--beta-alanine ligase n=1 Tax=Bradyrhizobium sp. CCGE-LA001 TaxID=1223566 RepID=UPI0009FB9483|nr:pantoate--beta-alanine ligase [Bradyrhizobium sp. CCGE-LA001]